MLYILYHIRCVAILNAITSLECILLYFVTPFFAIFVVILWFFIWGNINRYKQIDYIVSGKQSFATIG